MNVLEQICADKREYVKARKNALSLGELKARIREIEAPRSFIKALQSHERPAIIAEVKKASPSKGIIREDFDAVEIAKAYETNGAACLSVLTDTPYFQGTDEYLEAIKKAVSLPCLRKDFMVDAYQIYESRMLGADCILIIMAALSDSTAKDLHDLARELGMDVLVEVHDEEELERSMKLSPQMVGVNARNLKTLSVDIQTSYDMLPLIPDNVVSVAESGIDSNNTLIGLQNAGFDAFLVGESLMRQSDIGQALRTLRAAGCCNA